MIPVKYGVDSFYRESDKEMLLKFSYVWNKIYYGLVKFNTFAYTWLLVVKHVKRYVVTRIKCLEKGSCVMILSVKYIYKDKYEDYSRR